MSNSDDQKFQAIRREIDEIIGQQPGQDDFYLALRSLAKRFGLHVGRGGLKALMYVLATAGAHRHGLSPEEFWGDFWPE